MKLPTIKDCEVLFRQYHVPKNIENHCKSVSTFATQLAQRLKRSGIQINVELVQAGSMLHDLMKAVTLETLNGTGKFAYTPNDDEVAMWKQLRAQYPGMHETQITFQLLNPTYPELAQFIKDEGDVSNNPHKPTSWEVKVVHYSDWRFIVTTKVPLQVRMDDLHERYVNNKKIGGIHNWDDISSAQRKAEKEICDALK